MTKAAWRQLASELRHRLVAQPVEAVIESTPVDLRLVGRTLLHAVAVGVAAGLAGVAFVLVLDGLQAVLLERLVGYVPLRARGEEEAAALVGAFRWWLLPMVLAAGGLAAGLLTRIAPEVRGGGADATLDAYHHAQGWVRGRVFPVKWLASLATLASGGAGGREGPTIQMGGALGSLVARLLGVGSRERRILLLAGAAAGIAAVFRTPLGAALLVVELVYADGFENDALVPSVLASVVGFAVATTLHSEGTLLGQLTRYPFVPVHLPLYALLALVTSLGAFLFVRLYDVVRGRFAVAPVADWLKPALGALGLGALVVPLLWAAGEWLGTPARGLGLLGGGYGLVQASVSGAGWLGDGWRAVGLLAALAVVKGVATSLTVGSGGSAGDFAPSMAMGGILGGAFGRAAQLLFPAAGLDPGAFALVGMGAFYGGIAHAPLAALVMVCELAGTYDLLVPAMLAQGIAFVALRRVSLYHSQKASAPGPSRVDEPPSSPAE